MFEGVLVAQFFSLLCRESVGNKNDANDHSDAKTAVFFAGYPVAMHRLS